MQCDFVQYLPEFLKTSDLIALMMKMELVSETMDHINYLRRLSARGSFFECVLMFSTTFN